MTKNVTEQRSVSLSAITSTANRGHFWQLQQIISVVRE